MSAASSTPQAKALVGGRYRLDEVIGEGGMARVWRAEDLVLHRSVALKFLLREAVRGDRVEQFTREARIGAAVRHPNVVDILDFGTMGATPYMVMELLDGESLEERLMRDPPLSLEELFGITCAVLDGLSAVHRAGIVHRDLKPDNIFLLDDEEGLVRPKLLDFGVSRTDHALSGRRSAVTTTDGRLVGTPEYMAPEQARGRKDIDWRVDIYAAGVILYEGITGELPFDAEGVGDLIIEIVAGGAKSVFEHRPDVGKPISDVIEKAMSSERDDRYASAVEMRDALLVAAEQSFGRVVRPSMPIPTLVRHAQDGSPVLVSTPRGFDSVSQTLAPDAVPPDSAFEGARSGTRPVLRTPSSVPPGSVRMRSVRPGSVSGAPPPTTASSPPSSPGLDSEEAALQPDRASQPTLSGPAVVEPVEAATGGPSSFPALEAQRKRSSVLPAAAAAGVGVALLMGVGAWVLSGDDSQLPAEQASVAAPPVEPAEPEEPAHEATAHEPTEAPASGEGAETSEVAAEGPAPTRARVELQGVPAGARVALDGRWTELTDGAFEVDLDGREHQLEVRRGARSFRTSFVADADRTLAVQLRLNGNGAVGARSAGARPASAPAAPAAAETPPEPPSRGRSGVFTDLDY